MNKKRVMNNAQPSEPNHFAVLEEFVDLLGRLMAKRWVREQATPHQVEVEPEKE